VSQGASRRVAWTEINSGSNSSTRETDEKKHGEGKRGGASLLVGFIDWRFTQKNRGRAGKRGYGLSAFRERAGGFQKTSSVVLFQSSGVTAGTSAGKKC